MSASTLVDELVEGFHGQVQRALGLELDGSVTSLAFVDHHLRAAREAMDDDPDPSREAPILTLVAAGAGAYFGELVRREIGGTWIGDGKDPRRLRLLLAPQFLHFSPVDQAFEVLIGDELRDGDARVPEGPPLDTAFRVRTRPQPRPDGSAAPADASWLDERLAEMSPVPADHYYTLTARYETLELILELLAQKHASEGRTPRRFEMADYADELVSSANRDDA